MRARWSAAAMRAWLVLLLVPFAGCLDTTDSGGVGGLDGCTMHTGLGHLGWELRDPTQDWSTVLLTEVSGAEAYLASGNAAQYAPGFAKVTSPAGAGTNFTLGFRAPSCNVHTDASFGAQRAGATAEVGKGVLVYTAGFYENGTLFYTNMDHFDRNWPAKADWYTSSPKDPLQVYVYDEETSEQPLEWGGRVGTPLGPIGTATAGAPNAYFPTIKGFNDGLKGLSTTTTRVVHMAPEDAYTREGAEEHPLYGDALVFLQHIIAVADQPCAHDAALPGCFRS